jgi:hypothetical protein
MAAAPPLQQLDFLGRVGRSLLAPFMPGIRLLDHADFHDKEVFDSLQVIGATFFWTVFWGAIALFTISGSSSIWLTVASVVALVLGALALLGSAITLNTTARVKSRTIAELTQQRASDPQYRDVEKIIQERTDLEERLFERNVRHVFDVRSFQWRNAALFEDGIYTLAPRVNVLLGRNGYGKTLFLRNLVAMLQNDQQYSTLLFPKDRALATASHLAVEIGRNGDPERILRDATYFDSPPGQHRVGKIPLLAIPDSRFLDRTRVTVAGTPADAQGPIVSGARNFLTQEPFTNMIEDFLTILCMNYGTPPTRASEQRGSFRRGVYKLVEDVVAELTDDRMFQFTEINLLPNHRYEILVNTTDTPDMKIPIQAASQGTLSVVAIFGMIYNFLRTLRPGTTDAEIQNAQAIVVIDEIDAHLHPSWQQKIIGMLTRSFPKVQFIVSGHSPLIVAGCDIGEVSVLKKRSSPDGGRFYIDTIRSDFLGARAADLYQSIFNIKEEDRLYLEYSAKTPKDLENSRSKIAQLENVEDLSPEDEQLLSDVVRQRRLIERAEEVREQRLTATRTDARMKKLQAELERARYELLETARETETLREQLRQITTPDSRPS